MAGLTPALALIGVLAAGLSAVALAIGLDSARSIPAGAHVLEPVVGASFAALGLLAWWRRPANRIGLLMSATGLGWLVAALARSDAPLAFTVGVAAIYPTLALLTHTLLAYPSGRLEGRVAPILVVTAYVSAAAASSIAVLGDRIRSRTFLSELLLSCDPCPLSPLHAFDSGVVTSVGSLLRYAVFAVAAGCVAAVLAARVGRAPPRRRRALVPVALAGAPGLALLLVASTITVSRGGEAPGEWVLGLTGFVFLALTPVAMCIPLMRGEFRVTATDPLLRGVGRDASAHELSGLVRDALGDPGAEVVYWRDADHGYRSAGGEPVERPAIASGRALVELRRAGARVGAIVYDERIGDESAAITRIRDVLALAIDNLRVAQERADALDDARASRARLARAADDERRRIARDLHDGAQQHLMSLAMAARRLADDGALPPDARERLDELGDGLDAAAAELRALVHGIMPPALVRHGVAAAVRELADRLPLTVGVADTTDARPATDIENAAYFVAIEALTNAVKHARANAARVDMSRAGSRFVICVEDDGVGGAAPGAGTGLRGMEDRVAALNGTVLVEDRDATGGTRVRAEIPWRDTQVAQ